MSNLFQMSKDELKKHILNVQNLVQNELSTGIDIDDFLDQTNIFDEQSSFYRILIKTINVFGRETKQTNQPLFYIYDDGTVEKRITIEWKNYYYYYYVFL